MKKVSRISLKRRKEHEFTENDRIMLFITKFHLKSKRDKILTLKLLLAKGSEEMACQILRSTEYRLDFCDLLEDDTVRTFYLDMNNTVRQYQTS